jgi:Arabinose-binding domain of AraC transcription regulator, N-term
MARMIRSACLTDYVGVSRSVGLNPYRMLDAAGLPRASLSDPDMMIPAGAVGRLLEASAKAAGIDDFGLRLAEMRGLSNLGPVGLVVREQPTIRKAIEALIRYIRLHNEAVSLRIEETDDLVILSPTLVVARPAPIRQAVELSMGVLCRILRLFLGGAWKPQTVCFTHVPPKSRERHRRVFGTLSSSVRISTASSAWHAISKRRSPPPTRRWRAMSSVISSRSRQNRTRPCATRCGS